MRWEKKGKRNGKGKFGGRGEEEKEGGQEGVGDVLVLYETIFCLATFSYFSFFFS